MAANTNEIRTNKFVKNSRARDDAFEDLKSEDGIFILDVMANDLGGQIQKLVVS